jgi:putative drug exporter of the RND superfamily
MATVFSAFVLTPERVSKEFGLLLAVAILTDALIVKMTLIPALFTLIGEKTWYMPRWLDKLLPNITIEPPHHDTESPPIARPAPSEATS